MELSTDEWLEKAGIDYMEYHGDKIKYDYTDQMYELKLSQWRQYRNEQYNNRVLYCGADNEYVDKQTKEYVPGFDKHESDMITLYGTIEENYINATTQQQYEELIDRIKEILSPAELRVITALQTYVPQYCADDCPSINECDMPRFNTECKRHLRGNRWIRNNEVAEMLGIDKSAITQMLKRLREKIVKELGLTNDFLRSLDLIDCRYRKIKPRPKIAKIGRLFNMGITKKIHVYKGHCPVYEGFKMSFGDSKTVCNYCDKCVINENVKNKSIFFTD
jgi:DNA-binding MarR family transcriptional regulator